MRLIGIAGPAGSGKDTAANHITRQWGYCHMAFADPIKEMLAAMFDIPRGRFEANFLSRNAKEIEIPGLDVSPRKLMQTLGTEWGRQMIHPDLWVLMAANRIASIEDNLPNEYPGIVFSDVRFDNEANMIRAVGGHIIHIERDTAAGISEHISEHSLTREPEDIVVSNNQTIEDLERAIDAIGIKAGYREAA